ncbi:MAG: DUF3467 domain-containing protein [Candidatus Nanohaloarchaeota archaeon QJJ-5]|nr:DUF3467 domain-containing protein [Candidatus Nanohaloarchaeota archaeon QJJ-5]
MSENQQVRSDLGESFAADGVAIMFREGKLVLDFRKSAPRVDQIGDQQQQSIKTEHQPIVLDPRGAKVLMKMLEENIDQYEQQFDTIELPEQHQDGSEGLDQDYIG